MHYFINIGCIILLRKKPLLLIGQTKQALTDVLFFKTVIENFDYYYYYYFNTENLEMLEIENNGACFCW